MHPDWKGGTADHTATNNVLTIDKFTTTEDHIGLIWFNEKSHEEMPLQPREASVESARRANGKQPRIESGQRAFDSTRHAVKGGTALSRCAHQRRRSLAAATMPGRTTDGAEGSKDVCTGGAAIAKSPWTVSSRSRGGPETRPGRERLARASAAGIYARRGRGCGGR